MKTLHLTLKKKWFDMILSGEKKEEYREVKPYWVSRLTLIPIEYFKYWANESIADYFRKCDDDFNYSFDTITFKNGYSSNAPEMVIELKFINCQKGSIDWGAESGTLYFTLHLGEILSTKNITNDSKRNKN